MNLAELAREIHEQNVQVGWWDEWPVKTDRHETAMMLVISEIAEAMEGNRKNLMDDHLPQFKMFDVEIADALIRLLDLAGAYNIEFLDTIKDRVNEIELTLLEKNVPEQLYACVSACSKNNGQHEHLTVINGTIYILAIAKRNDIDIFPILNAKRQYNAKRADHKRENRAKGDGKKY